MKKQIPDCYTGPVSMKRKIQRNKHSDDGFVYPSYGVSEYPVKMFLFRPKDNLTNYLTEYFN